MRSRRFPVLLILIASLVLGACAGGRHSPASTSAPPPARVTTTAALPTTTAAPTTTEAPRLVPQASPPKAAAALIAAWTAGDRVAGAQAAEPAAVDALFAHPAVAVEQRGCNAPVSGTADCAYGIGRKGLLVLSAHSIAGGWTISTANYEG